MVIVDLFSWTTHNFMEKNDKANGLQNILEHKWRKIQTQTNWNRNELQNSTKAKENVTCVCMCFCGRMLGLRMVANYKCIWNDLEKISNEKKTWTKLRKKRNNNIRLKREIDVGTNEWNGEISRSHSSAAANSQLPSTWIIVLTSIQTYRWEWKIHYNVHKMA